MAETSKKVVLLPHSLFALNVLVGTTSWLCMGHFYFSSDSSMPAMSTAYLGTHVPLCLKILPGNVMRQVSFESGRYYGLIRGNK